MSHDTSIPDGDRFLSVTELSGDQVAGEQVNRMADRYLWASRYCAGKDVVEVACGTGQGLGILSAVANTVVGGDISPGAVARARQHYGHRVEILELSAEQLPFPAATKDVILLFEAIYYLSDVGVFLDECLRVLRPGGVLLVATANKELSDFNPSPYSVEYFSMAELQSLLTRRGFAVEFFGSTPIERLSARQRLLTPAKRAAVRLNLMPKTMAGKKLLKRLFFGSLVSMPAEINPSAASAEPPHKLTETSQAQGFKVILCAARRP